MLVNIRVSVRHVMVAALLLSPTLGCSTDSAGPTKPGAGGVGNGGTGLTGGTGNGGTGLTGGTGNGGTGMTGGTGTGGAGGGQVGGTGGQGGGEPPNVDISPPFNPPPPVPMTPGWQGTIVPEYSENYTFRVTANAPVRAVVSGEQILRDFTEQGSRVAVGSIWLAAGNSYELTVEAATSVADPGLVVEWESPSKHRSLVPKSTAAEEGLPRLDAVAPFFNAVFPRKAPSSAAVSTAAASGAHGLTTVMAIASHPNLPDVYLVGRFGPIKRVNPAMGTDRGTVFVDLSQGLFTGQDSGVMNMVFHPEYGQADSPNRNYFYVYYVADMGGTQYVRVSRLTATEGANTANRSTEQIMIQQRLTTTFHRGGGMTFGKDGYLYIGMGDFGDPNNGQDISNNLAAGILRIDVDQDMTRSHAIPRDAGPSDDQTFNRNYTIPNDNPFVGRANTLEEYYALGERNPHKLTMDRVTGRLLVGNVGGNTNTAHEEVNEVVKGGNYGWPFREGTTELGRWSFSASGQTFQVTGRPATLVGTLAEPNLVLERPADCQGIDTDCLNVTNKQAAKCIIGGYVYRGSLLPQLEGRYIYGDCNIGTVWATANDRAGGPPEVLFQSPFIEIVTFGEDKDGELYLGGTDGEIFKLVPSGAPVGEPPARLSQTGIFSDLSTLTPAAGVIPYNVNTPLWSDAAAKERWMILPNDGTANTPTEKINPAEDAWEFPVGTVFVKHFALEQANGPTRRLETRVLTKGEDNRFYGVTYRWRTDNSDAELQNSDAFEEPVGNQVWHYPSRSECGRCHNSAAGYVLGLKTAQLNRPQYYPSSGLTANSLSTFQALGMFTSALMPASLPRGPSLHEGTAFVAERARSYLDSNCAHCHRPGGPGRGEFDARFITPLDEQNLVAAVPIETLDLMNAQVLAPQRPESSVLLKRLEALDGSAMPPLAKDIVDPSAAAIFRAWLAAMNEQPGPGVPTAMDNMGVMATANAEVPVMLVGMDADGDALDYRISRMPVHGTLEGFGKDLVYRPHPDFAGIDGFTFLVTDGAGVSQAGSVKVTVAAQ